MNNLIKIGIPKVVVDEMVKQNDYPTIENLNHNYLDVYKIISYLQKIGIKPIVDLLINYTNIFFLDIEEIEKRFNNKDIQSSVEKINEDTENILNIIYE